MSTKSRIIGLALGLAGIVVALVGPSTPPARAQDTPSPAPNGDDKQTCPWNEGEAAWGRDVECVPPGMHSVGRHRGYVATRAPILEDGKPIWAIYQPDKEVEFKDSSGKDQTGLVPGEAKRLHAAKDEYEDALVINRDEAWFVADTFAKLDAQYLGRYDLFSRDEYVGMTLAPRTLWVMTLRSGGPPGTDPILAEFPVDPLALPRCGVTECLATSFDNMYLVQTKSEVGAGVGKVLHAEPKGIITYLAAFFGEVDDSTNNVAWGHCEDYFGPFNGGEEKLNDTVIVGGERYEGRDDVRAFSHCDAGRVGRVWGPIVGAWVDAGARWMVMNSYGVQTNRGVLDTVTGGQAQDFKLAGRYDLEYHYLAMTQFWDTMYVTLNFQPMDIRAKLGSRWMIRKQVQAGATIEFDVGKMSAISSFNGGGGLLGFPSASVASWDSALTDTKKWRSVNFPVEVSYTEGQITFRNEERPGIQLLPGTGIQLQIKEDREAPTYLRGPMSPGRSEVPMGPISRVRVENPAGDEPDGSPSPVYDADLLQQLSRADFANTDVHVFGPAGDLVTHRVGLRSNESPGLECERPDPSAGPHVSPKCTVKEREPAAHSVISDFIRNRYPGARYKVVVINRSTGYMGTGVITVGNHSNNLRASQIKGLGPNGSEEPFITLRPPNLSIEVTRAPTGENGNDAFCGDGCERIVGFEGGGLTTDLVLIRTTWRDWDGSPLPAGLPGFTGRLSQVVGDSLGDAGNAVLFPINSGTTTQVVQLPNATAHHYYIHVSGANNDRCRQATDDGETHFETWKWFGTDSPACAAFINELQPQVDSGEVFQNHPERYVPIKVKVFDGNATARALQIATDLVRSTPGQPKRVSVAPVYKEVYRGEQQFTVYDLPAFDTPTVITTYDPETGKTGTKLDFGYHLGNGGFDPLEPHSVKDPTWSLGFDELLAMVNNLNARASYDDLETIHALSPAGQLGALEEELAGFLDPADYLALQLYLGNDRGNPLYQDFDIPYLIQVDAQPISLTRNEILSGFKGDAPVPPYIDAYHPIPFRVIRDSYVTIEAIMTDGQRTRLVEPQPNGEPLEPGLYYYVLDMGALMAFQGLTPSFELQFQASLPQTAGDSPSQFKAHIAKIPVSWSILKNARPMGEIIEHDVNILDGSLRLTRQDFSFPGLGPQLSFVRNYTNLGSDGGDLGPGWSHSLNNYLVTLGRGILGSKGVPDWVDEFRGKIKPAIDVESELFPQTELAPTLVRVNGATFVNTESGWVGEKARQATLSQCDMSGSDPDPTDCFSYRGRDGTVQVYDYPLGETIPGTGAQSPIDPVFVSGGLAERIDMPAGAGTPGQVPRFVPAAPTPVKRITDRFGNTMTFHRDDDDHPDRITSVVDATERTCELNYDAGSASGCSDDQKATYQRLRRVDCLDGEVGVNGEDASLTVTFCYNENGYLSEVRLGKRVERYGYAPDGEEPEEDLPPEGEPSEETPTFAPYNLTSFANVKGAKTTIHYEEAPGPHESGIDTEPLRGEDMVSRIELPSTQGEFGPLFPEVTFDYVRNTRTVSDPRGGTLNKVYTLNQQGNPTRIEEPRGKYTVLGWSQDESSSCGGGAPDGAIVLVRRVVNRGDRTITTTFGYDDYENITHECGPGGYTQEWDPEFGLRTSLTDFRGIKQAWSYDAEGFVTQHTYAAGNGNFVTNFTRDPAMPGLPKTETAVGGSKGNRVTEYEYDSHGNVRKTFLVGVSGSTYQTLHDARGRLGRVIDRRGAATSFHFDQNDNVDHVDLPNDVDRPPGVAGNFAGSLSFEYDGAGHRLFETDRNGLRYDYSYTEQGQVKSVTRAADRENSVTRQITYDELGNVTSEQDWEGVKTRFVYDDLGFTYQTFDRLGNETKTLRDYLGNVTSHTDAAGLTTIYTYDALNRELTATPQCSEADCVQRSTDYEVDEPLEGALYVSKQVTGGRTTYSGFDARNLLVRHKDAIGGIFEWHYDRLGQLEKTVDQAKRETTFEYDARGYRTASLFTGVNGAGPAIVQRITPDANGNPESVKRWRNGENSAQQLETITDHDAWNRPRTRTYRGAGLADLTESFWYDGEGNLVEQKDTGGRVRKWDRDKRGQLRSYTDAESAVRSYSDFDNNGNARLVSDPRGVQTTMGYDAEERLLFVWEGSNRPGEDRRINITERDGLGKPKKMLNYRGNEVSFDYTARHQLKSETYPGKPAIAYTYTAAGRVHTITNQRGYVRTFVYDGLDRVQDEFFPDANTRESHTTYDAVGNIATMQNLRGALVEYVPDQYLRVEQVKRAGIVTLTQAYDDLGNVVSSKDAEDVEVTFEYNNRNQLVSTFYADGAEETREYYDSGALQKVIPPSDAEDPLYEVEFEYDNEDRVTSRLAAGERTTYGYDPSGNLTKVTNPEGQPNGRHPNAFTELKYDALSRLDVVTDPVGLSTKYIYDAASNLEHVYGPYRGEVWSGAPHVQYNYDPIVDRVTERLQYTEGPTLMTTFDEYDAHDNVKALRDPNGRTFRYEYDHYDRLTASVYQDDPFNPFFRPQRVDVQFDDAANVITTTETKKDQTGATVTDTTVEEFDMLFDRLVRSSQRGVSVAYDYFNNGNRRSVSTPNGTTRYTYDNRNRLETATINGATTTYGYHADGRARSVELGNGTGTTYRYSASRRVSEIRHEFGGNDSRTFAYAYDKNGNPQSVADTSRHGEVESVDLTTFNRYDAADRLLEFTQGGRTTTYEYERYNRKWERVTGAPAIAKEYTYDSLSERVKRVVEHQSGSVADYVSDNNGNIVEKTVAGVAPEHVELAYNVLDQLTQVTRGPPDPAQTVKGQFDYDAAGRRVRETGTDRGTVTSTYDGIKVLEEAVSTLPTPARLHYAGGLLARTENGADQYFHRDVLGSTANTSGAAANASDDYRYSPFGEPRALPAPGSTTNGHTFTGQLRDSSTGFYYYGARYYDPALGRFLTADTWQGNQSEPQSLQKFLYGNSNPGRFTDPTGHQAVDEQWPSAAFCRANPNYCPLSEPEAPAPQPSPWAPIVPGREDAGPAPAPEPKATAPEKVVEGQVPKYTPPPAPPGRKVYTNEDADVYGGNPSSSKGSPTGKTEVTREADNAVYRDMSQDIGDPSFYQGHAATATEAAAAVGKLLYSVPKGAVMGVVGLATTVYQIHQINQQFWYLGPASYVATGAVVGYGMVTGLAQSWKDRHKIINDLLSDPFKMAETAGSFVGLGGGFTALANKFKFGKTLSSGLGDMNKAVRSGVSGALGKATGKLGSYWDKLKSKAGFGNDAAPQAPPTVCTGPGCAGANWCFAAGTSVSVANGQRPIEELRVGQRVHTEDGGASETKVDEDWRTVELTMPNPKAPRDVLSIVALRSPAWFAATGAIAGAMMWFELPEMGLEGWASVNSIRGPPPIEQGPGRVILATVTHLNNDLYELKLEGLAEPLQPTGTHRLFSEDRGDWVPTSELQVGEALRTASGEITVEAIQRLPGAHRVYNIEVETEHSYFVSDAHVLSHNVEPCGEAGATNYGDIPSEHHWRYDRYLAADGKLGPAEWLKKAETAWSNSKAGPAFEVQVREALGSPLGRGSKPSNIDGFVPDLPAGLRYGVTDVKDWIELSASPQTRAFYQHARQQQLPMNLIVSPRTQKITEPLLDMVRQTEGRVFQYDPGTRSFTRIDIGQSGLWKR